MNQLTEENLQNIKCNQKSTNTKSKNKKTKDRPETSDEITILNQDKLSEVLVNTLHLNNINSNITNGTSVHLRQDSSHDLNNKNEEDKSPSEEPNDVNNVQCSETTDNGESQETSSSDTSKGLFNFKEALENLNKSSSIQDETSQDQIKIISYESELQMPEIMRLIQKDLSEPYSIYTYRYFIHNWPKLCFLAIHEGKCIGAIVCKLDMHRNVVKRGYIAMLAVDEKYRNKKIGSRLVRKAIQVMIDDNADEVVLETEITNKPALKLYENLGFVKDKRLFRYYLNGVDALRLKLWLR